MADDRHISVTKLNDRNYTTWSGEIRAQLMRDKCWRIVDGTWTQPVAGASDLNDWLDKQAVAAGTLFLTLEPSQRVHVTGKAPTI